MTDQMTQFLDEYGQALHRAGELGVQESYFEHLRKVAFSTAFKAAADGGEPASKAEHTARTAPGYLDALKTLHQCQLEAAEAKAVAEHMKARLEVWRTRSADRRAKGAS